MSENEYRQWHEKVKAAHAEEYANQLAEIEAFQARWGHIINELGKNEFLENV